MSVCRTVTMFLMLAASAARADGPANKPTAEERRGARAQSDRSAAKFARKHHPELADLLERLRSSNPRAYRAAMQDLSKDRLRLERLRERAPQRYDFELQLWTMNSQIRLLAAQAARGNVDEIRPQLQNLLQKRREFQLDRLRQERDRVARRLQRVENRIDDLEAGPAPDDEADSLLSRVRSRMQTVQTDARPADSPAAQSDQDEPSAVDSQSPAESPQD